MDGVLHAHDKIAERERLLMTAESPLNAGEPVDPVITTTSTVTPALPPTVPSSAVVSSSHLKSVVPVTRPAFVPEPQSDDHIKVVRIEKTQDPLVSAHTRRASYTCADVPLSLYSGVKMKKMSTKQCHSIIS